MVHDRELRRLREAVLRGAIVFSVHADEEMSRDDLLGIDVEHCILSGRIVERQTDRATAERKDRIEAESLEGRSMEVLAKLSVEGAAFIIAGYEV